MMPGNRVAIRTLTTAGGEPWEATLGVPELVTEGEWRCPFSAGPKGAAEIRHAHGLDAFQALMMAIVGIRTALKDLPPEYEWEGGAPGDHGFPLFVPQYFGPEFSRHIESIVEAEVKKFAARAKRRARATGG